MYSTACLGLTDFSDEYLIHVVFGESGGRKGAGLVEALLASRKDPNVIAPLFEDLGGELAEIASRTGNQHSPDFFVRHTSCSLLVGVVGSLEHSATVVSHREPLGQPGSRANCT